jgi:hypothetical protein
MQAPADATTYPIQNASPIILPAATVAVIYNDHRESFGSFGSALHLPEQHSPPGLIIATTIVLRI